MGLAPRLRVVPSTKTRRELQPWCLPHFRDGPTELVMVREKGDRHRDATFSGDSSTNTARSQSPFSLAFSL
jgi:hypothetical protein